MYRIKSKSNLKQSWLPAFWNNIKTKSRKHCLLRCLCWRTGSGWVSGGGRRCVCVGGGGGAGEGFQGGGWGWGIKLYAQGWQKLGEQFSQQQAQHAGLYSDTVQVSKRTRLTALGSKEKQFPIRDTEPLGREGGTPSGMGGGGGGGRGAHRRGWGGGRRREGARDTWAVGGGGGGGGGG